MLSGGMVDQFMRANPQIHLEVPNQLLAPIGSDTDIVTFPVFLPDGLTTVRCSDCHTYVRLKYWLCLGSALS